MGHRQIGRPATNSLSSARRSFGLDESHGSLGDIAWDLRWEEGPTLVTPLHKVIAWMEPLDLSIVVHPEARFSGTIEIGGERFVVTDLPGTFTHYWGRRLMDRWIWLSATQFEGAPERRLEAIVSSSRLFGGPPLPLPAAYLWTTDGTRQDMVVSPLNGAVRTRRIPGGFALDAVRIGGPRHRVVATWGEIPTNDLGEGIRQTLHADLTIDGTAAMPGTVGLETRGY